MADDRSLGGQFHPSRDQRPPEYELPHGGNSGVNMVPGGYYPESELAEAKQYWVYEGGLTDPKVKAEAGGLLNPAQGRLFDAEKHEKANLQKQGRKRFYTADTTAEVIRNDALQRSTIPSSHLQERRGRQETELTSSNQGNPWQGSGASGWYMGPATSDKPDTIAIDPNSSHGTSTTFVHEAGHRRHLGEMPAFDDLVTHPGGRHPDPLKEGVADAYVDRYGGPNNPQVRPMQEDIEAGGGQKFTSYQFTGYSSDKEASTRRGWTPTDRALYAATRAHGSETGEQPFYEPQGRHVAEQPGFAVGGSTPDPTVDATLHRLLSESPHAAQALRQTGLKDVGAAAFRRHRDRQLLTQGQEVQESLFTEMRGVETGKVQGYVPNVDAMAHDIPLEHRFEAAEDSYDQAASHGEPVWPHHMSHNQFGETPRSTSDVRRSLGVHNVYAKKQGFTS